MTELTLVKWCRIGRVLNRRGRPWIRNVNFGSRVVIRCEGEIPALPKKAPVGLLLLVDLKQDHVLESRVDVNLDKIFRPFEGVSMEVLCIARAFERLPTE